MTKPVNSVYNMATATTALHMLALRLERADALHLAAQIHALNTLAPHTTSSTPQPSPTATTPTATPLAGGYILTSAPQYTHKLNRASGLATRTESRTLGHWRAGGGDERRPPAPLRY